jgi:hypothetical protein
VYLTLAASLAAAACAAARLHRLPAIAGLPPFAMGAVEIVPFLHEISDTPLASHPFVAYVTLSPRLWSFLPFLLLVCLVVFRA